LVNASSAASRSSIGSWFGWGRETTGTGN
jgi:hypothetical protein